MVDRATGTQSTGYGKLEMGAVLGRESKPPLSLTIYRYNPDCY